MSANFEVCSYCHHELANPSFQHGVWDTLRFEPLFGKTLKDVVRLSGKTEEEWAEEAKSHKLDCPWIEHRGAITWVA